jgi:hypothetical protein
MENALPQCVVCACNKIKHKQNFHLNNNILTKTTLPLTDHIIAGGGVCPWQAVADRLLDSRPFRLLSHRAGQSRNGWGQSRLQRRARSGGRVQ